jgi:hypothetical protein
MLISAAPAQVTVYNTTLAGANEEPPNASPGTGTATVTIDAMASTMRVETSFSGLLGTVTAAHIHCCTTVPGAGNVGVATQTPTFSGFPSGVTSGMYDMTFDLTNTATYNGSFVTNNGGTAAGAMNALLTGLSEGRAYLNIHSNMFQLERFEDFSCRNLPLAYWPCSDWECSYCVVDREHRTVSTGE